MRIEDIEEAYGLKAKAGRLRGMAMELADALAKGYTHGKVAELLEGDMKWMLNTNKPKTLDGDDVNQLAAIVACWMKAHSDGLMYRLKELVGTE